MAALLEASMASACRLQKVSGLAAVGDAAASSARLPPLGSSLALPPRVPAALRSRGAARAACKGVCVAALSVSPDDSTGVVLVDHYKRLGVSPSADNAEIMKAFEARCLELTEGGSQGVMDEEAARQRLQELETSLEVLTSEEGRRLYDWGVQRAARGDADEYVWPFETDLTQKTYTPGVGNPPRPMAPVDNEGIATLGNIFLAWFILSAVLSCTLQ